MRTLLLGVLLLGAFSLSAGETFRVLVPLYLREAVPGVGGSLWQSTFAVHNPTDVDAFIEWCSPVREDEVCPADLNADEVVKPGETQTALPLRFPYPSRTPASVGSVVYITRVDETQDQRDVAFQLRVRDLSRNALSAGTEIPVVREGAFRSATLRLLSIPIDNRFRPLLRIYEMNLNKADFAVRVIDQRTGAKLSERVLTLEAAPQGFFRFTPGYAQTADIFSGVTDGSDVRIEIEPLSAGSAFWSFVSITNNETQEFTIITPQ